MNTTPSAVGNSMKAIAQEVSSSSSIKGSRGQASTSAIAGVQTYQRRSRRPRRSATTPPSSVPATPPTREIGASAVPTSAVLRSWARMKNAGSQDDAEYCVKAESEKAEADVAERADAPQGRGRTRAAPARVRRQPVLFAAPSRVAQHEARDHGDEHARKARPRRTPTRHPHSSFTQPPIRKPATAPSGPPSWRIGERAATALERVEVADHRVRGRKAARFADAHADACEPHVHKTLREPTHCGHPAPDRERDRDDRHAVAAVGDASDGNAKGRVEEGERDPGQQAELRVRQAQVRFDRLDQDREDLPIERVQRVDPDEHREGDASGSRTHEGPVGVHGIGVHGASRIARDPIALDSARAR